MIKRIDFKLNLQGRGIVNYDGSEQRFRFNKSNRDDMKSHHNNVMYAKKTGDDDYKIVISSGCLKNTLFSEDLIAQSPTIMVHKTLYYNYLASPHSILRGYMFADKTETTKRKGSITITDAVQTCNAKSSLTNCSRSGKKDDDKDKEVADNTFFRKETVQDIKYSSFGVIDMESIEFMSVDQVFDRFSFNPDYFESLYKPCLQNHIPQFNSNLGYFVRKGSVDKTPELGFTFSAEVQEILVKIFLKKLLAFYKRNGGAICQKESLEIRLVTNVIDNGSEWITLSSEADVDALKLDIGSFYEESDIEESKSLREEIEGSFKSKKQENNERVKTEKADRKKFIYDKKAKAKQELQEPMFPL